MKHILFLIAILFISIKSDAQITINQNDLGTLGITITLTDDTLPSANLDLGTPGTGKTWDFSMLNDHITYQYKFINVANTPFASTFPNANEAIEIPGTGYYYYMFSAPAGFYAVGQSGDFLSIGNDVAIRLNPADIILEFPSTYLSAFTSNMAFDENFLYNQLVSGYQVDSIRYKSTTHKTSIIDAWGTITTPEGSFPALRQNTENEVIDTVWGLINIGGFASWVEFETDYYIENGYSWYANGIGMPIVEVKYDTATNTAFEASWVLTSLTSSENDDISVTNKTTPISAFPNPAQDFVYINYLTPYDKCVVTVFDALGRNVKQMVFSNNQPIEISIANLDKGLYLFEIKMDDNKTFNQKVLKK